MSKVELTKKTTPVIDADFPGGNIIVDAIDGDTVTLHQDLRDTEVFWFYWYFRVRGAAGRTLTFRFTQGDVLGTRGPALSLDEGRSWRYLGRQAVDGTTFTYTFPRRQSSVRFCFSIPYLEADLHRFLSRHNADPHLRVDTLCQTRKGRIVELLHLGHLDAHADPDYRVLLTSRHHACESIATYSLEGLMEAVLSDTEYAQWLREHVEFFIVPFMDKDGVEDGDQGKKRHPRDHNRDYDGVSLYATTRALRDRIPMWSGGKLGVALDLHCPYISGEHNEVIYFVGGPDQANWERVTAFSEILATVQTGPLRYCVEDNLPFGRAWNTMANVSEGKSFSRWAVDLPDIEMASSLEIPYANVREQTVTAAAARDFGHDLARALAHFLRQRDNPRY